MGDVLGVSELSSGFRARFERDLLGDELTRTVGKVRSRWTRDTSGRPLTHVIENETETLRAVGYQWTPNDRLKSLIDSTRGPTHYRHDARGYLAAAHYPNGQTDLRLPDAVGNLYRTETCTDRKYGPAGELLWMRDERGETHCTYDPEGNLITKREPTGATWKYEWNAAGMLRAVTRPDGSQVSFKYDPLARRVAKTYRGQTTRWVWDANVPLHEWVEGDLQTLADAGGVPWANADEPTLELEAGLDAQLQSERGTKRAPITWLFDPESFAPLSRIDRSQVHAVHCDHLGTPVLDIDRQGDRSWSTETDVSGAARALSGARYANPFRWPGQYEDAETGFFYNRCRYYDPSAGQYSNQDPIGLEGGIALFAYVPDPLAWVDPIGLSRRPWVLTVEGTSAKRVSGGRTYYKHRGTDHWWSPDTARHGGVAFKVYLEKGKDLIWYRDADEYGNFIPPENKHKGPKGRKICGS
ncbi:MAG TPA: RHS repeat-associated core domain-containing protein [Polyangiales bacterium]|nr:RHS repeat-associated core domain-containing protein [Polyangiales bacterium]